MMDNFRKYGLGIAHSSLLGAGLLGMYLSYKKHIPRYMSFLSCYIACLGLYSLAAYLLEDEYEESDEDSPKCAPETPISKRKLVFARRITREEFDKATSKFLNSDVNASNSDETRPRNVPVALNFSKLESFAKNATENSTLLKLETGENKKEIIIPTSPLALQMLDLNNLSLVVKGSEKPSTSKECDIIDIIRLSQKSS